MTPSPPAAADQDHIHKERRAILLVLRWITYGVYALVIVIEVILSLGFILLLLGANPTSGFVEWWYRNLDRVMEPFRGIFTPIELGMTQGNEVQSIFETSVLFAMIFYAIVAVIVHALAQWLSRRLHRLDLDDRAYHERMAIEHQAYLDRASAERVAAATSVPPPPRNA